MSVRFNSHLISIWNKSGSNLKSIKALGDTIIQRLSPELRPTSSRSYFYKRHDEHEGYQAAVEAKLGPGSLSNTNGNHLEGSVSESGTASAEKEKEDVLKN